MVILDYEESYAGKFMTFLNEQGRMPFTVIAFSEYVSFLKFAETNEIEILIAAEEIKEKLESINAKMTLILSEHDYVRDSDYGFIYKYQAADILLKIVLKQYNKVCSGRQLTYLNTKKTSLIGVYSPIKSVGQTSFAVTLGQVLEEQGCKTLYINLEPWSGFEELLGKTCEHNLTDILYSIREEKNNVSAAISDAIQRIGKLEYIQPADSYLDIKDIKESEWECLLKEVIESGTYENIILDLNEGIEGLFDLLLQCERVYVPVKKDLISQAKIRQMNTFLTKAGFEEVLKRMEQIEMPMKQIEEIQNYYFEQLLYSNLGKWVYELLYGGANEVPETNRNN